LHRRILSERTATAEAPGVVDVSEQDTDKAVVGQIYAGCTKMASLVH